MSMIHSVSELAAHLNEARWTRFANNEPVKTPLRFDTIDELLTYCFLLPGDVSMDVVNDVINARHWGVTR